MNRLTVFWSLCQGEHPGFSQGEDPLPSWVRPCLYPSQEVSSPTGGLHNHHHPERDGEDGRDLGSHKLLQSTQGPYSFRLGRVQEVQGWPTWTNVVVAAHLIYEALERRQNAVTVGIDLQDACNMVSLLRSPTTCSHSRSTRGSSDGSLSPSDPGAAPLSDEGGSRYGKRCQKFPQGSPLVPICVLSRLHLCSGITGHPIQRPRALETVVV